MADEMAVAVDGKQAQLELEPAPALDMQAVLMVLQDQGWRNPANAGPVEMLAREIARGGRL